jgi:cytosine/adenosine deaminase-related metal-dependent hydrolase
MSILIKNGRIVTAVDDYLADVFIEGEKVTLIGKDLKVQADKVIDATGKLVIPGGIDPHTHFDMPSAAPPPPTTSPAAPRPPPSVAPPASSTSPSRARASPR